MSAKQSKRLRQAARGLAVTLDEAGRKISERDQAVDFHGTRNKPDSLRGIIRTLKKGIKTGRLDPLPPGKIPKP
jgi:hypothetical protein